MNLDFRPKNLKFFFLGSALFVAFLLTMFLETKQVFGQIDPAVTVWIQTLIPRSFDAPLSFFSLFGAFEITSLVVVLLGLFILRREKRIYLPLAFFGVILVFEFIGKLFLSHPGPPAQFFRFNLPFFFPSAYVNTGYSFPSGHVSRTLFLAVVAWFLMTRHVSLKNLRVLLTIACILLAVLMAVSRVYLGEHWTSDVLGGVLLGSSMGLFTLVYY